MFILFGNRCFYLHLSRPLRFLFQCNVKNNRNFVSLLFSNALFFSEIEGLRKNPRFQHFPFQISILFPDATEYNWLNFEKLVVSLSNYIFYLYINTRFLFGPYILNSLLRRPPRLLIFKPSSTRQLWQASVWNIGNGELFSVIPQRRSMTWNAFWIPHQVRMTRIWFIDIFNFKFLNYFRNFLNGLNCANLLFAYIIETKLYPVLYLNSTAPKKPNRSYQLSDKLFQTLLFQVFTGIQYPLCSILETIICFLFFISSGKTKHSEIIDSVHPLW